MISILEQAAFSIAGLAASAYPKCPEAATYPSCKPMNVGVNYFLDARAIANLEAYLEVSFFVRS